MDTYILGEFVHKFFAVATTAALVLTAAATPAAAQNEKINISGMFYLDRNGDNAYDAGDGIRTWGPGVRITNQDTKESFEARVGANGQYGVYNLPKGPTYTVENLDTVGYSSTKPSYSTTETVTNGDFPLRGHIVRGFSFVDANGDGVKQAEEKATTDPVKVSGKAAGGTAVDAEATPGENGEYVIDLPVGDFTLTAANLTGKGLALAKPKAGTDIDWVSGTRKLAPAETGRTERVDLRYFEPKADGAIDEVTISPVKDAYTVGEQIDVKIKLANKGDVPGKLNVIMFSFADVKVLSRSDNVTGANDDFVTAVPLLPGESIIVEMKLELGSTEIKEIYPFAHPFIGLLKDVDRSNQGLKAKKPIKVVEKGVETTTPTTTPATTTAPTTTTTPPAVTNVSNKGGLASTGASVLGFIALGSLLLVAGAGAFLVARRRRS